MENCTWSFIVSFKQTQTSLRVKKNAFCTYEKVELMAVVKVVSSVTVYRFGIYYSSQIFPCPFSSWYWNPSMRFSLKMSLKNPSVLPVLPFLETIKKRRRSWRYKGILRGIKWQKKKRGKSWVKWICKSQTDGDSTEYLGWIWTQEKWLQYFKWMLGAPLDGVIIMFFTRNWTEKERERAQDALNTSKLLKHYW